MEDQHIPVEEGEFVYRRVHRSFYDENLALPIQPTAFRPNQNDMTGLSVFRSRFVAAQDTLANIPEEKRDDYVVVRIAVGELARLGLSVKPEPDLAGPPGHAVIPELAWDAYNADKKRLKEVQLELAALASADIAHRPSTGESKS